jgi:pimeloyl-ACP methyl ester carboxylesterase
MMATIFIVVLVLGLAALSISLQGRHGHQPDGEFITVDGTQLHYSITGPEDAPVVLVLHGASSHFAETKLALEDDLNGFRAIWLDRPGLGWSERPSGYWTPEREAVLIENFLHALDIQSTYLIGQSWGAAISMRALMDHPETFKGAVLVAPALRAWVGDSAYYNALSNWPVIGPIFTRLIVPIVGPSQLPGGVASSFHPEPVPENYITHAKLARVLDAGPWRANAADMADVNLHLAAQEERYHEIAQPIILLAGPDDTVVFTHRHAKPVSETVQNGELRLIDGAGHNLHHYHGAAVAEALETVIHRAESDV